MKKNNIDIAIKNFVNSGNKILELWNSEMDNLDDYPFSRSFDEVMLDVSKWLENYGKELGNLDLKELSILTDVYNAILRKIKLHSDKDDSESHIQLMEELVFESNIDKLAYAKDKDGVIYSAKKSRYSMNAIILDGNPKSYYHFFENYIPYSL